MEKHYSLYGFMIVEDETGISWIQHVGDWNNTGEMMYLSGKAYIYSDVLLLGRSRAIRVDSVMKTFDDVESYLDSLPKWNRTKYYVKLSDIALSALIECESGEVVYSDRNSEILSNLRLIDIEIQNDEGLA
ncbi:MAG: hypothetical protein ACUVWJ_04080 [Spirochaetota bacterium]